MCCIECYDTVMLLLNRFQETKKMQDLSHQFSHHTYSTVKRGILPFIAKLGPQYNLKIKSERKAKSRHGMQNIP